MSIGLNIVRPTTEEIRNWKSDTVYLDKSSGNLLEKTYQPHDSIDIMRKHYMGQIFVPVIKVSKPTSLKKKYPKRTLPWDKKTPPTIDDMLNAYNKISNEEE